MKFEIRKVSLSNLSRFQEIFFECFRIKADEHYFIWKYAKNPFGQVIAFEATHQGEIAAFYGLIPQSYMVDGESIKVFQSMDTMTHPKFQKQGLFTTLANATISQIDAEKPNSLLLGIPGGNSLYGFIHKLGWKKIHEFQFIFLPKVFFLISTLFKSPVEKVESIEYSKDKISDFFKNRMKSDCRITPEMDEAFLKWRIFDHPLKKFKVVGILEKELLQTICIFELDKKNRAYIYFLDFRNNMTSKATRNSHIRAICRNIFENYDCNIIYTWKPNSKKLLECYKSIFFMENPFHSGPFSYRIPFIVKGPADVCQKYGWNESSNFDFQPIHQD